MTTETKNKINNMIFERAYEIENRLSADNYFLAGMAGLKKEQVSEVALKVAVKELKKEFSN